MEKGLEILQHIEKLYSKDYDEFYAEKLAAKNPDMVDSWDEAFKEFDLLAVFEAIDDFWQFKNSKSRPNVAQITAILNAKKAAKDNSDIRNRILKCADEHGEKWGKAARERYLKAAAQLWPDVDLSGHDWVEPTVLGCDKNNPTDYAAKLMSDDIKRGVNRHLLPVYAKAVRYVAEDLLSQEMPVSEWQKMSFGQRCEAAKRKGLFDNFENYLIEICKKYHGKEYQFESANMLNDGSSGKTFSGAANGLASHWRTDDVIGF